MLELLLTCWNSNDLGIRGPDGPFIGSRRIGG